MNSKSVFRALLVVVVAIGLTAAPAIADDSADELVQMVILLIGEKDKDLRAIGLEQVRIATKGEAATKQFVAVLPKLSPEGQAGLLSALADRGDRAARPGVWELLSTSGEETVRVAAIRALGTLGEAADVEQFVQLLGTGTAAEKSAARASLVRLSGELVSARIVETTQQSRPPVRIAALEILATRRALETIPSILQAALDEDGKVRTAAMTALSQLATPEHLPGLIQGVLKAEPGKERDVAERCVSTVCGQNANVEHRADPLLAAVGSLGPGERISLLPTVGRVGGPAALREVEGAIADADAARHEMGIRAICNWPEATIAPRLVELIRSEEHPKHRGMALAALVRLAPLADKRSDSDRLALLQQALALCQSDEERQLVVRRARAIRTVESLRFLAPYLDDPAHAQLACESVVELAHHRGLREPNKPEFDKALDKIMATSKDAVVVDRAKRYKNGQTWVRPAAEAKAE